MMRKLTRWIDPSASNEPALERQGTQLETNQEVMDQSILDDFSSLTPIQLLAQNEEHTTVPLAPFEFDENTLRSLQQFIESQGLHPPPQPSEQVQHDFFSDN
jgi:hypothetical protein